VISSNRNSLEQVRAEVATSRSGSRQASKQDWEGIKDVLANHLYGTPKLFEILFCILTASLFHFHASTEAFLISMRCIDRPNSKKQELRYLHKRRLDLRCLPNCLPQLCGSTPNLRRLLTLPSSPCRSHIAIAHIHGHPQRLSVLL
jgi:hypothetical protein